MDLAAPSTAPAAPAPSLPLSTPSPSPLPPRTPFAPMARASAWLGSANAKVGQQCESNQLFKFLLPELCDTENKMLVVVRLLLYVLAVVLVLDWQAWGMMVILVLLSIIATILAMGYVKSFNGAPLFKLEVPVTANKSLFHMAFYGSAAFLFVPLVHIVLKPELVGRVGIAAALFAYTMALLHVARKAANKPV